jgi:hypothetical protein
MSDTESQRRRRWITLGEMIALAALAVSAIGVWISWKSNGENKSTRLVEQRQSIPLTLRGKRRDDGRTLEISPVESSHTLESLSVTLERASSIQVGSDGELAASDVESALKGHENEPKDRTFSVRARIDARYIELGRDRRVSSTYTLRYMWKGGGLFGGRSLHLLGLSRS